MDCSRYNNTSSSSPAMANNNNNSKEKQKASRRNKGVKLSTDPQSVAARERRHRISDRFKVLQSLVPGGTKMDTVSMLEEAIHYVKFLKTQIWLHQTMMNFMEDDPSLLLPSNSSLSPQTSLYPSTSLPAVPPPPTSSTFQGDESMLSHVFSNY